MSKDLRNTIIAAAIFILLSGLIAYHINETQTEIDAVTVAIQALDDEIANLKKEVAQELDLRKQLAELDANFKDYVQILPSAELATEERLLRWVQGYCDQAQVKLKDITVRPSSDRSEFQSVSVLFSINADFESFIRFLNYLERHQQFLKVNSFSITPQLVRTNDGTSTSMTVSLEVTTFKYVAPPR